MASLRKNKNNIDMTNNSGDFTYLNESSYANSISDINGVSMYNFINAMKNTNSSEFYYGSTYERMMDDAIISSAIDLYVDDSTQIDPNKKKMCWVEVDSSDDKVEDELAKGLVRELNNFLDEIDIQKNLPLIARRVLVHGDSPVKLSFVDTLEDDKLEVHKLNESNIELPSEGTHQADFKFKADISNKPIRLDEYVNSFKDNKRVLNKFNRKTLKESVLKEDANLKYNNVLRGRWYIEQIGTGSSICALKSKGKIIALLDREDSNNIITKDNIAFFMNPKSTNVTVEVGNYLKSADSRDYYTISKGDSFLKNARIAWQVLSSLEDILLLTRMTRSILYRIFSVEVSNKGNKETMQILNSLKQKIKMDETVNVREKIYNSTISQVPLGDSIFIPTRNGVGAIKVDTIGGDFNLRDAIDLDYFKDKLFSALKIPRSFLGFEDDMPGSLGNTSLVRMDIRYARTVRGLQNILSEGIKDLIDIYLKYTRTQKVLDELPTIRVCMTSINTAEDVERVETEKIRMETVDKIIESLGNLGIEMDKYKNVRDGIIREWFGSEIIDNIKKDEESMPTEPIAPRDDEYVDDENDSGIDFKSTPVDVSFGGDDNDFGSGPSDDLIGGEDTVDVSDEDTSDASNDEPQNIPYSLK